MISLIIIWHDADYAFVLADHFQRQTIFTVNAVCRSAEAARDVLAGAETDIALIGIGWGNEEFIGLIRHFRESGNHVRCLAVAVQEDEKTVEAVFAAGAMGLILSDSPIELITEAITQVAGNGAAISPTAAAILLRLLYSRQQNGAKGLLTPKESELMELLSRGLLHKEIAAAAGIRHQTVQTHMKRIFAKLGAKNKIEALRKFFNDRFGCFFLQFYLLLFVPI